METEKCRALLCTIERGSITAAAEALGYTTSGVSRMLSALESEMGFPLLLRRRDGVLPTRQCTALMPALRDLVQQAERCRQTAAELQGVVSGTVAVATIASIAAHWLPNMIASFQADYPGVDFQLLMGEYAELESWLSTGRADMAFLRLPTRPEFYACPVEQDELMAVVPEDHPLAARERISAAALCDEPFILLDKAGRGDPDVLDAFRSAGLMPKPRFTTYDDYVVMSLVEHGLGVSVLPRLILTRTPYHVAVRPLEPRLCRQLGVATRRGETLHPAAERFLLQLSHRTE